MYRKRKFSAVTPTVIAASTKTLIEHIPKQPVVHERKGRGNENLPFYYQYRYYGKTSSKDE